MKMCSFLFVCHSRVKRLSYMCTHNKVNPTIVAGIQYGNNIWWISMAWFNARVIGADRLSVLDFYYFYYYFMFDFIHL